MSPQYPSPAPSLTPRRLVLVVLGALASAPLLTAAAFVWDPADATNGTTIDTGSGTWNTAVDNLVWNSAGANVAWTNGNSAQFGGVDAPEGTSYTVTLDSAVTVASASNGLWFSNSGYLLTAPTARTVSAPTVTTSSGKTAALGGSITVTPANNAALTLAGFGTLSLQDGARLTPISNNLVMNHGNKLTVKIGGVATTASQIVVGSGTANSNPTLLAIEGGTLSITNTSPTSASNIVLANVASGTAAATATLSSGEMSNTSPIGGVRFGPSSGGAATVSATINLDGGTLTAGRLYEGSGSPLATVSTLNLNGGTLRAVTNTTNGAAFLASLDNAFVKAGGARIDTNGASITIAQPLLADALSTGGGLTKLGAGVLTLSGANSYTGPTLVSAGTLAINAPYPALTATAVEAGARLRVVSGGTPSPVPSLSLAEGSGIELDLGVFDAGRVSSANVTSLDAAGNYTVDLTGTNIPVGNYTVLFYSFKTGAGLPSVGALPPGVTANVVDNGSSLVLEVLTPQLTNYFWSAGTGVWDTTTPNWTGQTYVEGRVVTFPDLAGDHVVTLDAARAPFSVSLQNNLGNTYTLSGASITGAATLVKTGTGAVTLASANSYTGVTTVNAGALIATSDAALGTADGSTTLTPGTALALSGGITYATTEKIIGSGNGTLVANVGAVVAAQRGLVQASGGASTFAGPVEINATGLTRFGVQDGASLTLSGPITAAPGVTGVNVLFRTGIDGDFITLASAANQWDGTTTLFSSTSTGTAGLRLGVDNGIPVASSLSGGGTSGNPRMTFDLAGYDQTLNGLFNSNGYLSIQNSANEPSVLTLDLLTADVDQSRTDAILNLTTLHDGPGAGKLSLVKKGVFKQTLSGVHTYTGPTTIEAGTLAFTTTGTLGATPVTLLPGSTLDVAAITASEFALVAGLAGSGTLHATDKTVTVATTFTPGALAVTGSLTLAADTATTLVAGATPEASSVVTVSGALVLNGTLAITEADGFDLATGQNFTFATGTITPGLTGVTLNGTPLTETTPDVWTGNVGGLDYTFTESTATLAVTGGVVATPLQAWRDLYFPGEGNDGTGIGANDFDADNDGIDNLVEYATHTSPIAANVSAVVLGSDAGRLTLTFPRIDDPALRYTVEARDDLATGTWTAITPAAANNPTFGFVGSTPGVTETVAETVIDPVLTSTQPKRFLRLAVEVVPPTP